MSPIRKRENAAPLMMPTIKPIKPLEDCGADPDGVLGDPLFGGDSCQLRGVIRKRKGAVK